MLEQRKATPLIASIARATIPDEFIVSETIDRNGNLHGEIEYHSSVLFSRKRNLMNLKIDPWRELTWEKFNFHTTTDRIHLTILE
jgi:hypothetical protein